MAKETTKAYPYKAEETAADPRLLPTEEWNALTAGLDILRGAYGSTDDPLVQELIALYAPGTTGHKRTRHLYQKLSVIGGIDRKQFDLQLRKSPEPTLPSDTAGQLLRICPELADEIARCCEQAYRRGYEQGAFTGAGLDSEIHDWRYDQQHPRDRFSVAAAPPDRRGANAGYSCSALKRLWIEVEKSYAPTVFSLVSGMF